MRSLFKVMKKRIAILKDDYLDWSKIPVDCGFVAVDAIDTGPYPAGTPIAYQREPTFIKGRWLRKWIEGVNIKKDLPVAVPHAIIGKVPQAADSLRKRPVGGKNGRS